jgi:DNA mismatch repair protein MutL
MTANTTLALTMARHAAIPYGQLLSNAEMDVLVNDLFACENVNYTPDGRAILCILPQQDIEHLLG